MLLWAWVRPLLSFPVSPKYQANSLCVVWSCSVGQGRVRMCFMYVSFFFMSRQPRVVPYTFVCDSQSQTCPISLHEPLLFFLFLSLPPFLFFSSLSASRLRRGANARTLLQCLCAAHGLYVHTLHAAQSGVGMGLSPPPVSHFIPRLSFPQL